MDLQRDRAGDHNIEMAMQRLRAGYQKQQALDPNLRDKTDLELYKETARPYVSFRETQSVGRNAQPAQPKTAKPKGYDIQENDGSQAPYTLPGTIANGTDYSNASPMYLGAPYKPGDPLINTAPKYQAGQETLGAGKKAMRVDGKEVTTTGSLFKKIYRANEQGVMTREDNNTKPIAGTYQHSFTSAVDGKGDMIMNKSKAEQEQMIHEGKASTGTFVVMSSIGNKDYTASYKTTLASLQEANRNVSSDRRKPQAVLEDEAQRMALHGSESVIVPYDAQQSQTVDADTKGFFKKSHQNTLQIRNSLRGANAPAAPPTRPHFIPTRTAAPKPAAPKTNADQSDKGGGMFN